MDAVKLNTMLLQARKEAAELITKFQQRYYVQHQTGLQYNRRMMEELMKSYQNQPPPPPNEVPRG